MCFLRYLPANKTFCGFIVREKNGHRFYTLFNNNPKNKNLANLKKNLEKAGAKIVKFSQGDKHALRKEILVLNKRAGLPGIGKATDKAA